MRIFDLYSTTDSGVARSGARIEWEQCDRPPLNLFVEAEEQFKDSFWADPNALLAACVLPAWEHGEKRVKIDAGICPVLRENLKVVFRTISCWFPELGPPPLIESPAERARLPIGTEAASLLSCGIDSLATLRRNKLSLPPEHPGAIRAVILVDLCETPSESGEEFRVRSGGRMAAARPVAADAGIEAIPILTNLWWLIDDGNFFSERWHGAMYLSAACFLSRRFNQLYIASSFNASTLRPWGSHPLSDPYYSSAHFQIVHDGMGNSRFEKTRFVADWPVAVDNVRVCQNDDHATANCGTCEKCIWTATAFVAFGKLQHCKAFPNRDVTAELIHTIDEYRMLTSEYVCRRYEDLIGPLRDCGRDDLAAAIERVLQSRKRHLKRE